MSRMKKETSHFYIVKLCLILNLFFFLILECSQLVLLKDFYGWAKQSLDSITGTMKQLDT